MTVISAIVELTKSSWRVLRRNPLLFWFPILSLATTILVISFLAPFLERIHLPWLAVMIVLFSVHFINVFFGAALTNEAFKAMRGGTAGIGSGIGAAAARAPAIAAIALVSSTLGLFLELLGRSRSPALRLARALLGTAWSLVTYLAIPVMMRERRSGIASLRRSGDLFRRTWGETALSEVGVRIIAQHAMFVLIIVAIVLVNLFGESLFTLLVLICLFAGAIGLISSLEAIYRTALYVFAAEGVVPAAFDGPELEAIWKVKPAPAPVPDEPPPVPPVPDEPVGV
jgi:hypothetical protein